MSLKIGKTNLNSVFAISPRTVLDHNYLGFITTLWMQFSKLLLNICLNVSQCLAKLKLELSFC